MSSRLLRAFFRFFAWWGGLFTLLAGGSVCPCCGTPTCPGGAASAGLLSGIVAVLLFVPRWLARRLSRALRRGAGQVESVAAQAPTPQGTIEK
jgi:hypothetical protein